MKSLVPIEVIEKKILLIDGRKVMLDKDLAGLYGVTTGNLNKAVNRNKERFPEDFMVQLSLEEFNNLKCHFGTSSWGGTAEAAAGLHGTGDCYAFKRLEWQTCYSGEY